MRKVVPSKSSLPAVAQPLPPPLPQPYELAGKKVITIQRLPNNPVVSIDKILDDTIYIRTSERLLFRRCRRLWGWNSPLKMNLEAKSRPDYFWFGTGMHYALEDFHGINQYEHPARAFEAYTMATLATKEAPDTWREFLVLGIEMMTYYADYWLKARGRLADPTLIIDGVPQTEVRFTIDLPIKGPQGQKVVYRGQIDRMVRDENGHLWVWELKSAKQFRLQHFDVDDQITAYATTFDTEALTRTGWKTHDQLVIGEEILGYNHETKSLEWTVLENIHYPGIRPTVTVSNKSFNFTCHEDHKWAQINENNKGPKEDEGKFELKPIKQGQQHHRVILSAPYFQGASDITSDEAAIIAWLLTDGNFTEGFNNATIAQSEKKHATTIRDLLSRLEDSCTRETNQGNHLRWRLKSIFLRTLWKKAGLTLDLQGWEQFLLGLSQEAIQAFCGAAMLAEGDANGTFYQNKGLKQDIFKMAFFLSGKFPSKGWPSGKGKGGFSNKGVCEGFTPGTPEKWVRTIKVTKNKIEQPVWCTQTALGTWVMRQEGQIAITGNCWAAQALYDEPIMGVIYQQHKKDVPTHPKILSTGKVSTNKTMNTSYALYRQTLLDVYGNAACFPADNIRFLNTLVGEEEDDADKFIRRDKIYRNQYQIAAQGEKILLEVEDMLREGLPLYPNPSKDCSWLCPLESVCVAMDDGSDFEGLLTALTINREEISDSWRTQLPHSSLLTEAPLRQELQGVTLQELLEAPEPKVELLQLLDLDW